MAEIIRSAKDNSGPEFHERGTLVRINNVDKTIGDPPVATLEQILVNKVPFRIPNDGEMTFNLGVNTTVEFKYAPFSPYYDIFMGTSVHNQHFQRINTSNFSQRTILIPSISSIYDMVQTNERVFLVGSFSGTNMNGFAVWNKASGSLESGWQTFSSSGRIENIVQDERYLYILSSKTVNNQTGFMAINKTTKQVDTAWQNNQNTALGSMVIDLVNKKLIIVENYSESQYKWGISLRIYDTNPENTSTFRTYKSVWLHGPQGSPYPTVYSNYGCRYLSINNGILYLGHEFAESGSKYFSVWDLQSIYDAADNALPSALTRINGYPDFSSAIHNIADDGQYLYVASRTGILGESNTFAPSRLAIIDKSTKQCIKLPSSTINGNIYTMQTRGNYLFIGGDFAGKYAYYLKEYDSEGKLINLSPVANLPVLSDNVNVICVDTFVG